MGITIDATLTWKPHIDNVCKICSRNVGILNKVKCFLPKISLYKLYCTPIMPYLTYGILLWGNASKEYITKLFKLQKRASSKNRYHSSYLCHTKPLFEKFNTLNIFELYNKNLGIFMYKAGMLPTSFDHLFANLEDIHNYNTRNKTNYRFDIHKIKSILIDGPKFWNLLPREVKSSSSVNTFKESLTSFLKEYL